MEQIRHQKPEKYQLMKLGQLKSMNYFTWADNTVVEDESRIDVDAATSASVPAPGNAARIAGWIQELAYHKLIQCTQA